jgi:hypothetical protein
MTDAFYDNWKALGGTEGFDDAVGLGYMDGNLSELQSEIAQDPKLGRVITGTGGFRETYAHLAGSGKSGVICVIYLNIQAYEITFLLFAYSKPRKEDLSAAERGELRTMAANIKLHYEEIFEGV